LQFLVRQFFFLLVYVIENKGWFADISHRIYQHQKILKNQNKWNKTKLTNAISNLTPKLTEQSINEQIDSAFKIWAKYSKFKKMKLSEPCNIKISFCQKNHNDGFDFDGKVVL